MGSCAHVLSTIWSLTSWDRYGRERAMNSSSSFFSTWSNESRRNTILKTITTPLLKALQSAAELTDWVAKMKRLTHIGSDGRAQMVDVSAKPLSKRRAVAGGKIRLLRQTLDLIARDQIAKGNVF